MKSSRLLCVNACACIRRRYRKFDCQAGSTKRRSFGSGLISESPRTTLRSSPTYAPRCREATRGALATPLSRAPAAVAMSRRRIPIRGLNVNVFSATSATRSVNSPVVRIAPSPIAPSVSAVRCLMRLAPRAALRVICTTRPAGPCVVWFAMVSLHQHRQCGCNESGFFFALDFDGVLGRCEEAAVPLVFEGLDADPVAHAFSCAHRRNEAHFVEAVVHSLLQRDVRHHHLERGRRQQCERQVTVRDRAAERAFARSALHVDVDPLAVAGAAREFVDARLIQRDPGGGAEFRADAFGQACDGNLVAHDASLRVRGWSRNCSIARADCSVRVSRNRWPQSNTFSSASWIRQRIRRAFASGTIGSSEPAINSTGCFSRCSQWMLVQPVTAASWR